MRLDDQRESSNFEVQSGGGGGFGGGGNMLGMLLPLVGSRFGCAGIAVLLLIMAVTGGLGGALNGILGGGSAPTVSQDTNSQTPQQRLSRQVLASTEDVWGPLFEQAGNTYQPTVLSFYTGGGQSGCGAAQSAMGPFYCPTDRKIYLDTSFYDELGQRYGAQGDFAQAYVIAHEVGHHIQNLLGTLSKVNGRQNQASEAEGNALQVRIELQADCFAGVWGKTARVRDKEGSILPLLEPGDVEEGMTAAQAIGDDTLQRNAGRTPMPDSFTHGSGAQRMKWLRRGLETGDPAQCDTFAGPL